MSLRYTATMRSPSGKGSPLSITPYTMLNIVVVRPMPNVSAMVATSVRPGLLASERIP